MMRSILSGLALTAALATQVKAAEAPVVVELFTSQGCSSCPPADAFLTDLARQRRDVLPLAFHVTYWNYLGWSDPFSFDGATARQRDYARHLAGEGVYTPQMVVDGAAGFVGSDRREGLSLIGAAKPKPIPVSVARDGDMMTVAVGAGSGKGRLLLVGFDHQHQTPVGRGENGGRTLTESNIVRSLTPIGDWTGDALTLRPSIQAGED